MWFSRGNAKQATSSLDDNEEEALLMSNIRERGDHGDVDDSDTKQAQNGDPDRDPDEASEGRRPTLEEQNTLPRISDKIPLAAFSVVMVELCERFSFYGLSGPFQNYLQNPLPVGGNGAGAPPKGSNLPAGALGKGQQVATAWQSAYQFFAYLTPVAGAIIADAKWGRYKTITVFCLIYFIGLLIILFTSLPSSLAHNMGYVGWIIGATVVAFGTGGIKANVSPLVADQYRKTQPFVTTNATGQRVIVDPNITITRIYNLFYWCINIGSLSSALTTVLERNVGFWLAFLMPCIIFVITPLILILSKNMYYKVPPRGSVIVEVWKCSMMALVGSWGRGKEDKWKWAKPGHYKSRLSELSIIEGKRYESITWDDSFVDEVQRTLRASQIFLFFPLYWIAYNQITTNLVSMAGTMTLNGVPNDLIQNANPVALVLSIPIIDLWIYPRFWRPPPILRITLGFVIASCAMLYSAFLQYRIYSTSPCGNHPSDCLAGPSPISVWVQVPSYVLIALSEIFASVTGFEYAYNKAPTRMKSVVMSLFLCMTALGSVINASLAPLARDPYLVTNYLGIAALTLFAGLAFFWFFRERDLYEAEENAIGK